MNSKFENILKNISKEDLSKMSFAELGLYLQMLNKIKETNEKV